MYNICKHTESSVPYLDVCLKYSAAVLLAVFGLHLYWTERALSLSVTSASSPVTLVTCSFLPSSFLPQQFVPALDDEGEDEGYKVAHFRLCSISLPQPQPLPIPHAVVLKTHPRHPTSLQSTFIISSHSRYIFSSVSSFLYLYIFRTSHPTNIFLFLLDHLFVIIFSRFSRFSRSKPIPSLREPLSQKRPFNHFESIFSHHTFTLHLHDHSRQTHLYLPREPFWQNSCSVTSESSSGVGNPILRSGESFQQTTSLSPANRSLRIKSAAAEPIQTLLSRLLSQAALYIHRIHHLSAAVRNQDAQSA